MTTTTVIIRDYQPRDQSFFERLYKDWFRNHFQMEPEPVDEYVLTQPGKAVLEHGGVILVAVTDGRPVGFVALKPAGERTFELTKMVVDPTLRGQGIGEQLCAALIERARIMGARKVVLYSHSSLVPAILLYKKLRFNMVTLEPGTYSHLRCDTKMELASENDNV